MLTPQENERLTRVGPGTPMGRTMRRYWMPAALGSELPENDGAPIRVRMLGEDLVAFRDSQGKVGLVDAYCPHRRAPMFFGRNEECGLRCVYHGWKFDRTGKCVDMPSEPPDSLFKDKVTIASYPTWEGGGMVWAYLGPPAEMPPPPDYELVRAPQTHRFVSKTFEEANWLQALEGGLDTAHSSFAHNMNIADRNTVRNADTAPRLEVEKTGYGFRYAGIRSVRGEQYVRVYHYLMPAQQCRGGVTADKGGFRNPPAIHGHIWVPIDDETTYAYNWIYSYDPAIPITPEFALSYEIHAGRGPDDLLPGFKLKSNPRNDYFIDRQVQKTKTFTGISGINTQDFALQQGMGPIVDRSREHLGTTDRAIIMTRQLLMEAIDTAESGGKPRGVDSTECRDVRAVDLLVPKDAPWREAMREEMLAKF
jgi:nitrite reductase/ring-hydroxylating ferredoxin subunit